MNTTRLRNQGGEATFFGAEGTVNLDGRTRQFVCEEVHSLSTYTCEHCNGIVHVPAKADVNFVGFCRNCMKPICEPCSGQPCVPFEKKLQMIESKVDWQRQYDANLRGMW